MNRQYNIKRLRFSINLDLLAFGHVAGEHRVKVWNGGRQNDLVSFERKLSDIDGDIAQNVTFAKAFNDWKRDVRKIVLERNSNFEFHLL